MKKLILFLCFLGALVSCKDDDIALFEKSGDERAAEAIAALRADLTSGPWKVRYKPETDAGSFWILLNFSGNGNVTVQSDVGANDGTLFEQTITYRIDSSMGLELILETYCVFSYLFERYSATFGAEYEFNFVNKTPDNHLVFSSKTDEGTPTVVVFERAGAADEALLGRTVSGYLDSLASDFNKYSSSARLTYANRDLMIFMSMDPVSRTAIFTAASRQSVTTVLQEIDLETSYLIEGDSIKFSTPLSGNFFGNNIRVSGISFSSMDENMFNGCGNPVGLHSLTGKTSQNDNVTLETTLSDLSGQTFAEADYYFGIVENIIRNGRYIYSEITERIPGAVAVQFYYKFQAQRGEVSALTFVIQNSDNTYTYVLREFTPTLIENRLIFDFADDLRITGNPVSEEVQANINSYFEELAQDDQTYSFKLIDGIYEFFNPCSGLSFVLRNPDEQ